MRFSAWVENFSNDIRYAVRSLRRSRAFALSALLTLALGIGGAVLIFTIVNSLVVEPPPFPESGRIHMLWQKIPEEPRVSFSVREFEFWQKENRSFEAIAAFTGSGFVLTGSGEPEMLLGQQVTPSFFGVLGTTPALGRTFLAEEGEPGNDRAVILSYSLWREKFGGARDVLGRSLTLNRAPYTVVGVMPPDFDFPGRQYRLWVPAALSAGIFQQEQTAHFLHVIGRLRSGVSAAQVESETQILARRMREMEQSPDRSVYTVTLQEMLNGNVREPLLVLQVAMGILLLIACANAANLMLARSAVRSREMAVRRALGAGRSRLLSQVVTESTVLTLLAGLLGVMFAIVGLRLTVAYGVASVPQLAHVHMDAKSIGVAALLTLGCGVLCGIFPAVFSSPDFSAALRETSRTTGAASGGRTRSTLVFAEVGLATALLVCSGLMLRSFERLIGTDPGFRPEGLIVATTVARDADYPKGEDVLRAEQRILEAIKTIPGFARAGMVTHLPFGGNGWGNPFDIEGRETAPGQEPVAEIRPASAGYLETMEIPVLRGRSFSERDTTQSEKVAVVNEVMAKRFWSAGDAIGKRIRFDHDWMQIVGVCGNVKHGGLDEELEPEIYVPYPQLSPRLIGFLGRGLNFVLRPNGNPAQISAQVRPAIRGIDAGLSADVMTMQHLIGDSVAQPRFRTWLIGILSAIALTLAAAGIYGVISYLVSLRRREIGVRMALGAQRADILRLMLGQGVKLAAIGAVAGLAAAFFLTRFLAGLLYGVQPRDPATFATVAVALVATAAAAAYVPARRAARANPMSLLKYE